MLQLRYKRQTNQFQFKNKFFDFNLSYKYERFGTIHALWVISIIVRYVSHIIRTIKAFWLEDVGGVILLFDWVMAVVVLL